MAASSSSDSTPDLCEPSAFSASRHVPAHEIFLSHSGAQKPFVAALYQRLREKRYSTFFDIQHHSLPLGEPFPPRIFDAARTCRLAVVVFSEEYVQSKWPMLELHAFVKAHPRPKILPLFLKLTVSDLRQKENRNRWHSAWQKFAEEDSRIDVSAWKSAFKKVLSHNGITVKQCEEESAYIERVVSRICESMPPSIRYDISGLHGIHRLSEIVLDEFGRLGSSQSNVCVLGMYGLPGSGKSTICRYLCGCLFPLFAGKVIHLELPTDANDEELLVKSKQLLKQLTNFNNKMDIDCVSNFREVYNMLKGTDIVSSRVFLVLDNISSQKSRDVVKALLRLGLAEGSKVLLVARSFNVLGPLLRQDGSHHSSHYIYGRMSVPGLNKEEALRLLLQSGDGVGIVESCAREVALTPRDKEIMEEVVNMSGFSEEHGRRTEYLPLVLKIMGEQFQELELNVEKWSRTMKSFQTDVGLCKEEALKQMVLTNFETLPRSRLRVLFLDVALFIVPLSYSDGRSDKVDEACLHLSLIHGCKSEEIKFEMQKLQQHGFLTIWNGSTPTISVHDFYLEFAASIEEASQYYWSSGLRWSKIQRSQAIEVVGSTQQELRVVVLELDEGYEHFKLPLNFSGVRALVLRNCMSLKILLGFANLRSLVSLAICNCPNLKWVEPPATGHEQPYIQRVKWVNWDSRKPNEEMLRQQELESSSREKSIWSLIWENLPQIRFQRPPMMALHGLLLQMNGLQVFKLENTGIRDYLDMSRCLPQLRVLEVREQHMKGLRVCNLPHLERFVFFGDAKVSGSRDISMRDAHMYSHSFSFVPRKRTLLGKEFLAGCPKVQEVYMQCVFFEDEANQIQLASSHFTHLRVNGMGNVSVLPDFSGSSESLEEVMLMGCEELRSLNFGCVYRNLRKLVVQGCDNLTGVSGFGGLPMLEILHIVNCRSLKRVSEVGDLVRLQCIKVYGCPNMQAHCLLPHLESLIELREISWMGADLSRGKLIGIERLERLETLPLGSRGHSSNLVDLATLLGITGPCCSSLQSLSLCRLANLRSLNGIQFLDSLRKLELEELQNLSCLRGIECLGELVLLAVGQCASVEEMSSLAKLVNLESLHIWKCKKLRSVKGCSELRKLSYAGFSKCENLESFPLDLKSNTTSLTIDGCKFASEEALLAWVEDEEVAKQLRYGFVRALNCSSISTCEKVIEKVVQKALNRGLNDQEDNKDGNFDEQVFVANVNQRQESLWRYWHTVGFMVDIPTELAELTEEGIRWVTKLSKQRIIDLSESNFNLRYYLFVLFQYLCNLQTKD